MSALEIFDCEQGSDDWFRVRLGMPTASEFSTVLMAGKSGGESKTRRTYLYKLAGERVTGEPMESYSNKFMERGRLMEGEARDYYAMLKDASPQRVGFIREWQEGVQPRRIDRRQRNVGDQDRCTARPDRSAESNHAVPPEHMPQLQGGLWVAEREWIDLLIYCPMMPALLRRVHRNEDYIAKLAAAVNQFNDELDALTDRIKARQ